MERFRHFMRKSFLCKVMPVNFLHSAPDSARTHRGSSRTVRALFTRWRVVMLENPLNNEIDVHSVASVTQVKSSLTVAASLIGAAVSFRPTPS